MTERTLRKEHYCTQYMGQNTECGDDAYDVVEGFWYCDKHAASLRAINQYAAEQEAYEREHPNWDIEQDATVEPPEEVLAEQAREQYEAGYSAWCDENDIEPDARGDWSREAYDDHLVGLAEATEDER